jgi:hypothetical protein
VQFAKQDGELRSGDGLKTKVKDGSVKLKTYHNDEHIFTDIHGNKVKRLQLVNKILDCIGNKKKCCKQISNEIGFEYQTVRNILRRLIGANILDSTPTKSYTYYHKLDKTCLLAEMFYNKEKILNNFKIKSVQRHNVEDSKFISYDSKLHGVVYNNSSMSKWENE